MSPEEQALHKLCQGHDWFYQYADDYSVWYRGNAERVIINRYKNELGAEGVRIYNQYAPKDMRLTYKPKVKG